MRIGIAHAALDWRGSQAIARSILEVTRSYPKTTVRLSSGWTPHLPDEVISGNLDAALILCKSGAPSPPEVTNYLIASDQLVAVAPRSLGIMKQAGFDELFNSPWVLNPDGCGYRSLLVSHAWSCTNRCTLSQKRWELGFSGNWSSAASEHVSFVKRSRGPGCCDIRIRKLSSSSGRPRSSLR